MFAASIVIVVDWLFMVVLAAIEWEAMRTAEANGVPVDAMPVFAACTMKLTPQERADLQRSGVEMAPDEDR